MNAALLEVWKAAPTGVALGESSLARSVDLITTAEGGVAKLRKLILALAVRGRLSTQRDSDESAGHLLSVMTQLKRERAAASRARAESAPSDLFAKVEGFVLPTDWGWASLGQLGWFASGKTPSTSKADYWDGSIPWVTPKDMKAPRLSDSEDHVSERAVADGLALIPPSAVLVVVRSGILRRMVPVAITQMTCTVNQDIKALTLYQPAMADYVQLMITGFESFILSQLTKIGTTVESIKFEDFAACRFPIPPLAEQHRIVARVEELMKLCDALEENGRLADEQHARLTSALFEALAGSESAHELAENWHRIADHFDLLLDRPEAINGLEQAILQLAVRGLLVTQDANDQTASELLQRLRAEQDRMVADGAIRREKVLPSIADEEIPFDLPTGWKWARLGDLANFIDYRGKTPTKTTSGVPLITAKNVRRGHINREPREFIAEKDYGKWMTRGFPRVGDLLFTTEAPLGNVACIDIDERFALAQRVICFGLYEQGMSGALRLFLMSPWLQGVFASQATGVTAQGIKSARLQLVPIPVPPLAEQHRIVARVKELRLLCADLRGKLTEAQVTQSVLAEALVAAVA